MTSSKNQGAGGCSIRWCNKCQLIPIVFKKQFAVGQPYSLCKTMSLLNLFHLWSISEHCNVSISINSTTRTSITYTVLKTVTLNNSVWPFVTLSRLNRWTNVIQFSTSENVHSRNGIQCCWEVYHLIMSTTTTNLARKHHWITTCLITMRT